MAYRDLKHRQLAAPNKSSCEASRRAECGKSARSVRRGGGWKPPMVRLLRDSPRKRGGTGRADLRVMGHSLYPPNGTREQRLEKLEGGGSGGIAIRVPYF